MLKPRSLFLVILAAVAVVLCGCKKDDDAFIPYFHISTPPVITLATGAPLNLQLEAAFGKEPYHSWNVVSGTLPAGLSLDGATGILSGAVTAEGEHQVVIEVSDSSDTTQTTSMTFTIRVQDAGWTFMFFFNGDNDLEEEAIANLDELEVSGGSTPDVNLVVQLDRIPGFDASNGDWVGTKRFYVTEDTGAGVIDSAELQDIGEADMGTQAGLQSFMQWAMGRFKAQKYALVVTGHGSTWKIITSDDTSGEMLALMELHVAIHTALTSAGVDRLDLLGFDSSLASTFEAVVELNEVCDVMVASAEIAAKVGWEYVTWPGNLRAQPSATAGDIATWIVNSYGSVCNEIGLDIVSCVALDMTNAGQAITEFEEAVDYLRTNMATEGLYLAVARFYANGCVDTITGVRTTYDLGDMFYVLRHITRDTTLQGYLDDFLNVLNGMVIHSCRRNEHVYSTGVSIFFPWEEQKYLDWSGVYDTLRIAHYYHWDDLLLDFYSFKTTYVDNLEIGSMTVSSGTVTPGNPVTVTADAMGDGIRAVTGFVYKDTGTDFARLCCMTPIHNYTTLPNGRQMENWVSKDLWLLSYQWAADYLAASDGTVVTEAIVQSGSVAGELLIDGQYSIDSGATWRDCRCVFNQSGDFLRVLELTGTLPVITVVPGDIFKPAQGYIDTTNGEQSISSGPEMDLTQMRLQRIFAEPERYYVCIEVLDPFTRLTVVAEVDVP